MLRFVSSNLLNRIRSRAKSPAFKTLALDFLLHGRRAEKCEAASAPDRHFASSAFPPSSSSYSASSPSLSIWRRKKEMGKEGLFVVHQLKRLQSNRVRLERFMRTHVSRLLRTDLLAVLVEFQRQDHVFLSMKVRKIDFLLPAALSVLFVILLPILILDVFCLVWWDACFVEILDVFWLLSTFEHRLDVFAIDLLCSLVSDCAEFGYQKMLTALSLDSLFLSPRPCLDHWSSVAR